MILTIMRSPAMPPPEPEQRRSQIEGVATNPFSLVCSATAAPKPSFPVAAFIEAGGEFVEGD
jgi:hypothetical protein